MAHELDIGPRARDRINALPPEALAALVEAFEVLAIVPERGRPLNADNPGGGLFTLDFGAGRG
ncbi:hypothetical protein [Saccharothrix yanglingensis]|uniref:hypothetical protein n=1 Tax=Saccharothrix yanglingensis TaxID=659496 RepID=UPI0027D2F21B|nr:hypothetical protein [Saccharothrix yanglingensis]